MYMFHDLGSDFGTVASCSESLRVTATTVNSTSNWSMMEDWVQNITIIGVPINCLSIFPFIAKKTTSLVGQLRDRA